MKKGYLASTAFLLCLLCTGCGNPAEIPSGTEVLQITAVKETAVPAAVINPLPDTTMMDLEDAILAVSLEEGDAYVDDIGIMQMDVKIYSYDKYDMVDIANLKVGDILATHAGSVEVNALEHTDFGTVRINGGLEANGLELDTGDQGVYYECGFNDAKNWYMVGEATIRVSADFVGYDTSDLDMGEVVFYPGSFLVGEVTNYNFTPHNTTIRIAQGQIVELQRRYTP